MDHLTLLAIVVVAFFVIKLIGYAIQQHYATKRDERFPEFVKGFEHGYHDVISDAESATLHSLEYYLEKAYKLPYGAYKQGVISGITIAYETI